MTKVMKKPPSKIVHTLRRNSINFSGSYKPMVSSSSMFYIGEHTGIGFNWRTTDSARQTSTSNMARHLEKHSIYALDSNPYGPATLALKLAL
ncbi:hypothetical protein V1509DRAFT_632428, partial [Lipomyces kononenkoae]